MTPERFRQVGELYHAAIELEPDRRAEFLARACNGDEELRREVGHLLASNDQARSFLATPALTAAAELIAEEQADALIGRRLGHYRILSRIGAGGMGEVYLAEDERLGRKVALKLLPAEFAANPDRLHRFEREAKAASATDHPNIVTIHEIGQSEGIHYIAEEYVEGETLRRLIERAALPPTDALDIAQQITDALAAAHAAGVVHRDIKPENVMLRPDGYVKVLDFGLASTEQTSSLPAGHDSNVATIPAQTTPGTILGTVSYMSPEQTRGQRADARSDLWSLGVVLYEMLTGQKPFTGGSVPDIFVAILDRSPLPLDQSMSNPPRELAELERILARLLAKGRDQRYASAAQLAADLKKLHRRLELEAELATETKSEPTTLFITPPVATPHNEPPATRSELAVAAMPTAKSSRAMIIAIAALAVVLIAAVLWWARQQKSPVGPPEVSSAVSQQLPERSFAYSLTVQKTRDGKPYQAEFQSSGRDIYENGWKFRFNFSSPQSGFLYIINEGPTTGGAISYTLLFPLQSINKASAQIEASRSMQTGWYHFNEFPGTEKFWVVWAAQPIGELEDIKKAVLNLQDAGLISTPQQRDTVRALLAEGGKAKVEATEDKVKKQTRVAGRVDALTSLVELEHH